MTNASAVSRVLYQAGIKKSELRNARICKVSSEGYEVETDRTTGEIIVEYRPRTEAHVSWAEFKAQHMPKVEAVLVAKGYTVAHRGAQGSLKFVVSK